jgi:flavin reductase (DIM6/NTAB) family NADH-FMN oxidoreductase RutF
MKELSLSKAYQFIEPGPVLFLVTSDERKPNLMSMSAHMVIEDGDRPVIGCVLGSWDYSFETLRKTGECVLAVPTADLATKVIEIGNCSGSDTDKFKVFSLTPIPAKIVKVPLVAECLVNLECRVHDLIGQYNLVILEVVYAWIDPEHKDQRMIHHNGNGTLRIDGETLDLRDKMVKWPSYVQR